MARIRAATDLALNAMWSPAAPSPAELIDAGVARVSLGTALFQSAYTHAQRVARELFTRGRYSTLEETLSYGDFNDAFAAWGQ